MHEMMLFFWILAGNLFQKIATRGRKLFSEALVLVLTKGVQRIGPMFGTGTFALKAGGKFGVDGRTFHDLPPLLAYMISHVCHKTFYLVESAQLVAL